MPTKDTQSRIDESGNGARAGVERSEPGGRAQLGAGAARRTPGSAPVGELLPAVRDRLSDELIDKYFTNTASRIKGVEPFARDVVWGLGEVVVIGLGLSVKSDPFV